MLLALVIALWCLYFPYNFNGSRRKQLLPLNADNLNHRANSHSILDKSVLSRLDMPALLTWIESGDTIIWNQEIKNELLYYAKINQRNNF